MASRVKSLAKQNAAASVDSDVILTLPLSEVHADKGWNSRTALAADTTDDKGEGDRGWVGNVVSIALEGQRDAVTVRPHPKPVKGGPKYSLVTGFSRHEIIRLIAAGKVHHILTNPAIGGMTQADADALKTKDPTIRVIVKNLTEGQAVRENLGENVQRNNLSGPDLAVGVMRLRTLNPDMSDDGIARLVNKSQPYVSKLKRIADGCSSVMLPAGWRGKDSPATNILDAWRQDNVRLTNDQMEQVAKEEDPTKRAQKYLDLRKGKAGVSEDGEETDGDEKPKPARGEGGWLKNAIAIDIPAIARMVITLQRAGALQVTAKSWNAETATAFLSVKRKVPPTATENDLDTLAGAITGALVKAAKDLKDEAVKAAAEASAPKEEPAAKGGKVKGGAAVNGAARA